MEKAMDQKSKIGVIGAGAWGTALALLLSRQGHEVVLWFYDQDAFALAQSSGQNQEYLPGFTLDNIHLTDSLAEACQQQEYLILASPTQYSREVLKQIATLVDSKPIIINTSKGIEVAKQQLMSQIIAEELPLLAQQTCFLSGPSFADEVARGLKTAVVVASQDQAAAQQVQELLSTPDFRVYTSTDIIGVQLGGALKNILAIAAGLTQGLKAGRNIQGALVARGLKEITNFGLALGAQSETFSGLSGYGDIYITLSNPDKSRNSGFGFKLGEGESPEQLLAQKQVVEGYYTTKAIHNLLELLRKDHPNLEMPIAEKLYQILYNHEPADQALADLFDRQPKTENGD